MDALVLEAAPREASAKVRALRFAGQIPAVYYGKGQKSFSLAVPQRVFRKIFAMAGENTIIELMVSGKKFPVLVYEVQRDPLSDAISHVDFIHVDMNKEVTTSVKVAFVGVSPAVKNLGGILDIQKHELKIKCLPKDLIHSIEVDVSSIADFTTTIHVKDVKLPSTIKIVDHAEDAVVTAVRPRAEEVEAKPAEAVPVEGAAATPAAGGAAAPAGAAGATGPQGGPPAATGKEAKK